MTERTGAGSEHETVLVGAVADRARFTTLDGVDGVSFWLEANGPVHPEGVPVFGPSSVVPAAGQRLRVAGTWHRSGTLLARRVESAPVDARFAPVAVSLTVPDLTRLRPARGRRDRQLQVGFLTVLFVLGGVAMATGQQALGGIAMAWMVGGAVWSVVRELRARAVDNREYRDLATTVAAAIAARVGDEVPLDAMLYLLGAGVERTDDPRAPSRPRDPQELAGWHSAHGAYEATLRPIPLVPGQPFVVEVTRVEDTEQGHRTTS